MRSERPLAVEFGVFTRRGEPPHDGRANAIVGEPDVAVGARDQPGTGVSAVFSVVISPPVVI